MFMFLLSHFPMVLIMILKEHIKILQNFQLQGLINESRLLEQLTRQLKKTIKKVFFIKFRIKYVQLYMTYLLIDLAYVTALNWKQALYG